MSRIQINLGLIGNVIMGARLRQHRLLDFVFVGNIISEPPLRAINAAIRASDRSTLSCGPLGVTLDATSKRHCLNICQLLRDVEARHRPFDAPTPCLVHQLTHTDTHTDEMRFLGTSGKMRYNINTIGRVRGITSF